MIPSVTFATSCFERDWRLILLDPNYLRKLQIGNHQFAFQEKLLIINNVEDLEMVKKAAQIKIDEGVIDRFVVANGIPDGFGLKADCFDTWQYYNALGPFTAIHEA